MPAAAFATEFHIDGSLDGEACETQAHVSAVGVGGLVQVLLPDSCTGRYLRVIADAPDGDSRAGRLLTRHATR